nr:hypothetical protein [Tanacetum cinerariifolium]GFA94726.1 hypothetical protein [Tanacetum cinerariifolium]
MHDNVDDLIKSALNSKLLSINLNSQRLDKKKQEVRNVVEQPAERRTKDKRECNVPVCENSPICDDHYEIFSDSNNDDDISSDEDDFEDIEYESDFDNPSFLRPPPEPPDAEFDLEPDSGEEISVVMNDNDEIECLDPRKEFDVEDNDYFLFMFVIRIFLPDLIYPKVFSLHLSAKSEDTIFDPGVSV